jgi:hypothetical protein
MEAQAPGQATAQASEQVHPIHQETATHNALTDWVKNNPDNDPHQGTDLEDRKVPQEQEPAKEAEAQPEAQSEETIEFDEETPIFEVELKTETGKEAKKLSLKELRDGYQRQQDYSRNIQKVKAQEQELTAKEQKAVLAAQQEYVQRLEVHKQAVAKLAGVKSLQEIEDLSRTDPAGAQQEFLRMISVNQTLQGIENEQRQAGEKLQASQQEATRSAILKSREILEKDIPGWGEEMYRKVISTVAKDYGFENKDVEQVYDHKLMKVLHDAYLYRQLQRAKPEASKKVVAIPKVLKPGSAEKTNTSSASDDAALRLKKTGRGEDFISWYMTQQKQQKRK